MRKKFVLLKFVLHLRWRLFFRKTKAHKIDFVRNCIGYIYSMTESTSCIFVITLNLIFTPIFDIETFPIINLIKYLYLFEVLKSQKFEFAR